MSNSSIWPIDRTFPGATTPPQSKSGKDGNKEVFYIPKTPALLEPRHKIILSLIQDKKNKMKEIQVKNQ